ncbi:hypothetical protein [Vibrio sonorensis]|uniref:hypothetical protein n=1 Tax=Vibrio sonorensis TaxID=1004316 RepID=UPI00316AD073
MQNNNVSHFMLVAADVLSEALVLAPFYLIGILYALYTGTGIGHILLIPILFLFILIFLLGAGLVFATITPILRDLPYLLGILLQIAFWLTPIAYAKSYMTGIAAYLVELNPFTHFILLSQAVFMGKELTISLFATPAILALVSLVIGITLSRAIGTKTVINL